VDDHANTAKCAVPQFIGRDSEVPIVGTDESPKNVHEETVAPSEFVRLACEKVPVDFGIARDPAYCFMLKSESCLAVVWLILVFGGFDLIRSGLWQFLDVLPQYPFFQAPLARLAGFKLCSVQVDGKVVTKGQGSAQHPLQPAPADFVDLFLKIREYCECP